jgi:hypothetical protein
MQDKDRPAQHFARRALLLLREFSEYGRVLTRRRFGIAKKRTTATGLPPSLAARIVADYLDLCHNPTKDWRRWLAQDSTGKGGGQHVHTEGPRPSVAEAHRLRR